MWMAGVARRERVANASLRATHVCGRRPHALSQQRPFVLLRLSSSRPLQHHSLLPSLHSSASPLSSSIRSASRFPTPLRAPLFSRTMPFTSIADAPAGSDAAGSKPGKRNKVVVTHNTTDSPTASDEEYFASSPPDLEAMLSAVEEAEARAGLGTAAPPPSSSSAYKKRAAQGPPDFALDAPAKRARARSFSTGPSKSTPWAQPEEEGQPLDETDFESDNTKAAAELAQRILRNTWGYDKFMLKQQQAAARLIAGESAVVVFPTGGGKSMVFQIPAIAFTEWDEMMGNDTRDPGVTLVVSPLIALMKDQVEALKKRGVAAAAMDSSQSRHSLMETADMLRAGNLKLLYVAPERLNNEAFVETIKHVRVRMVAVDEAHCISEWGHAFRPDYLKVARFVQEIQAERVLCLTATAAPLVVKDICDGFQVPVEGVFKTPTYRPNLRLLAHSIADPAQKLPHLITFLQSNPGPSIVYVHTHAQTFGLASALARRGFNAKPYHAGMTHPERHEIQDAFMASSNMVIVATIAFGMGIDKANIRAVVHYNLPKSLESYSQEIGRAGRDSQPSTCLCYLCPADLRQLETFSRADVPSLTSVRALLDQFFAENKHARRGDVVETDHVALSRDHDMGTTRLNLLFAQLELRFNLLRAITPRYSEYKYTLPSSSDVRGFDPASLQPEDTITAALAAVSRPLQKWVTVDVDAAAVPREQAVRRLQQWNDEGRVVLRVAGVVQRYRVLAESFPSPQEQDDIVTKAYDQIEEREQENMGRTQAVVDLFTASSCYAKTLAAHFGDDLNDVRAVGNNNNGKGGGEGEDAGCGHCGFCETAKPILFDPTAAEAPKPDKDRLQEVLRICEQASGGTETDARFLARIAWGISSPRCTKLGLRKTAAWESMADCHFEDLVDAFAEMCENRE